MIKEKARIKEGDNLTKCVRITYKDPYKAPVRISIHENYILMEVYIKPSGSMLKPYTSKKGKVHEDYTFADCAVNGIIRNYEKEYDFDWYKGGKVPVKLQVIRYDKLKDKSSVDKRQRWVRIRRTNISGTSFVMSPPYRWLWGLVKSGFQLESFGLNWSKYNPGTINLNKYMYKRTFEQTAAHEFGHVLGLGDAYDAFYRFGYEVPGTKNYMMNTNKEVQPEEMTMVLMAHSTNRMQYFPRKFFIKGLFRAILHR